MKFTLMCDYGDGDKITHEFNTVFIGDVILRMQDFLKGCGFGFDGELEIVDYETPDPYVPDVGEKPTQMELDLDGRC
jgi:hypothetical protein